MHRQHIFHLSFWGRLALGLCLLLSLCFALGGVAQSAHAQATITVSTCDEPHLDAAIAQANSDNANDTITFACSGDIQLTSTLQINASMTLDGSGQQVTLDGQNRVQVLSVNGNVTLALNALTIAHGLSTFEGGGLHNEVGTVSITNSTFANNSAQYGGGLFNNFGTVNITNSTFANNLATSAGGGLSTEQYQATVSITNSTFTSNSTTINGSDAGAGLADDSSTVSITNSTFTSNSAPSGAGAGLYHDGAGTVSITNSTFANNSTGTLGAGGGLFNLGSPMNITNSTVANNSARDGGGLQISDGTANITNSTVANNSATNGGGLETFNGTVNITNSTVANNSATNGGGLYNFNGFGYTSTAHIGGSIVANNDSDNCSGGRFFDQGYNLERFTDCGFTATGSLQNTDPMLDPSGLQNNGGPTHTIALLKGSPAIDQIPAANCPPIDQRGSTRPDDGETTCDIGAYESNYPPDNDLGLNIPATTTVDATSPQGAVVTYTPTAVDEDSPLPPVTCTPSSGSTFAIGTTTVTCTANDSDDTNSPVSGSFSVVVNGAATQVNNTITLVNSFHLSPGIQNSFDSQLQAVQADLAANNTAQACSDLTGFINHVKAQSGKELTVSQANQLIEEATQIQAVLGC